MLPVLLPIMQRKASNPVETISVQDAKDMLSYVADKIIESKPLLTEVDNAIGDGDHGIGMAKGLQKAKDKISVMNPTDNVYDVFTTAGKAMLMSMGGASGVIFGNFFLAGAKNVEPKTVLTSRDFVELERRSLNAIKEVGKAQPGDKTMVDALEPAVLSMEENPDDSLVNLLKKAETAAKEGVEKTKAYQAKYGRAKSLMERAIGHQDAGATSVWIIFRSFREFAETH